MLSKKNTVKHISLIILLLIFSFINIKNTFSESSELSTFESAKDHFKKGFIYFNRMQYLSAVEYFRKAVSVYPEYYTAREYLARSYKLAGYVNEAIKEWEIIAGMSSKNVSVMNKLDSLRYRMSANMHTKFAIGRNEYVYTDSYKSDDLGRFRFPKPIDLAIDSEKNIYITSFYSGKLIKLNSNGEGQSVFSQGTGTRYYGVDCNKSRVVVSDFKMDVAHILDKNLKLIKSLGSSGKADGNFHGPKGLCLDEDGNIYVVDSGNNRVQKFDKDGNFILKFGEPGEYEGQLDNPSNIFVRKDNVYVTDTGNKRIANFDDSGNFVKNITPGGISIPRGIRIYNNNLVISDEKAGLIFYSPENGAISKFESWDNGKKSFSKLVSSYIDRDGVMYCLDYNQENIFVFSPLQSVYTNLEIEVTSVEADKYPVVAFYLNVRKRGGGPVYNLDRTNFKILEDNVSMSNIYSDYLKNEHPSVSAVLCVDRSENAAGYHNDIPWVSDFILKKMKKNDSLQLMNFNKDAWVGSDFDWSRLRTAKALRKRTYSEGKAIDKALYNGISNLLLKLNRRGIVLISDGSVHKNSFEKYSPEYITEYAKSHYIPIYVIAFKEIDPLLKRIASETGGAVYKTSDVDGLRSIYDRIKQAEEYRYLVTYSSHKTPIIKGWWSDIKIEVNYKGHRGVEWGGYFVP
ncbi:MAG: hypothetical protein V1874_06800 [Spirochaetota bacterium]